MHYVVRIGKPAASADVLRISQTAWKTKKDDSATAANYSHDIRPNKRRERNGGKTDQTLKICGDCLGKYRVEDCGSCDIYIEKYKNGKGRQKEKERDSSSDCLSSS
ncbi:hypothetical protein WA026_016669 [Henosepilachna vigintioctopunctata]|uniref:Uncharacterized protein n=1 Tax=Henosepilachna vigintioctopunctata TaxID=420089 RepID=A0AAW1UYZ8_9CUCU